MEMLEIAGWAAGAVLVVIAILRISDYKDERPEDVEFK